MRLPCAIGLISSGLALQSLNQPPVLRFSPTRFIRRDDSVLSSNSLASEDKRYSLEVLVRHLLKRLWSLPLLLGGSAVSYQYWPTALGLFALLLSLLLFLPLVIVSLNDIHRAKNLQSQPAFLEINLPPPRPLFGGPIADVLDRIAGFVASLEGLGLLITVIAGIGVLGHVGVSWLIHFVSHAQYLPAGTVVLLGLLAVGATFTKIPAALIVVFGGAAVCCIAFLLGYGGVLLP
jgi:hypothetical protein